MILGAQKAIFLISLFVVIKNYLLLAVVGYLVIQTMLHKSRLYLAITLILKFLAIASKLF